jgi:hypothetical protein
MAAFGSSFFVFANVRLWPTVADQETRLGGVFYIRERQVMAESARLAVTNISHH